MSKQPHFVVSVGSHVVAAGDLKQCQTLVSLLCEMQVVDDRYCTNGYAVFPSTKGVKMEQLGTDRLQRENKPESGKSGRPEPLPAEPEQVEEEVWQARTAAC